MIAPAIIGFITVPIITHLFSPGDYGNYVLVRSTVSILTIIVGWLSMSIIRFYPVYERDKQLQEFYCSVIKWLLVSVLILIVIFASILILIKDHLTEQLYSLMLIGLPIFIFSSIFTVLQHFLRAKRQVGLYSSFSVWKSVATLSIGIALVIRFGFGIEGLLWGSVLGIAIALPLLWKLALEKFTWKTNNSLPVARVMAKYGFPLMVGNLAAWILSLSDRYILELYRGSQEVGIYSASYAISEKSILLLTSLFIMASRPIGMIIWEKEGREKSQEYLSKITRYYIGFCLPAVVGLSILARPVISILTVPEYYQGFRIIPLVALGGFFLGLQQRFQLGLIFQKRTNLIMMSILLSGLINLVLNIMLVPRYGYMAAALTTFVSYMVLLFLIIVISRRFFLWEFPFKSLGKISLASIVMAAILYPLVKMLTPSLLNLLLAIPLGIVVYGISILLLGEVRNGEKLFVKQFLKKHGIKK